MENFCKVPSWAEIFLVVLKFVEYIPLLHYYFHRKSSLNQEFQSNIFFVNLQQGEYNGRVAVTNRHGDEDDESNDRFSRGRPGSFRPESAPTVLNMSPECSLSGPPSVRAGEASNSEEYHGHMMHNGEEISGTYDGNIL